MKMRFLIIIGLLAPLFCPATHYRYTHDALGRLEQATLVAAEGHVERFGYDRNYNLYSADRVATENGLDRQPVDRVIIAPAGTYLEVSAAGLVAPSFQWQRSNDGGETWENVPGGRNARLYISPTDFSMDGQLYRCVVTDGATHVFTRQAQLTIRSGNPLWWDAEIHGGWRRLAWFGWFAEVTEHWIYHMEHGWLYVVGDYTLSIALYDLSRERWAWTGDTVYSWLYWFPPLDTWTLYLRDGSPGQRWFFDTQAGTFIHETELSP